MAKRTMSARLLLRAFQSVRGETPDAAFMADLAYVQHKDLDLSVRLGAMLAFDALAMTAAINPIAASPGAPLCLDAARQPIEVLVVCLGILLLAASALCCVRAMLIGEEYTSDGIEDNRAAIAQRLFAAYCLSVDKQGALLALAVRLAIAGGTVSIGAWGWIMLAKITGFGGV